MTGVPRVVLKADVAVSPELLWQAIRDFAAPNRWHPLALTLECDGDRVGSTRRVKLEGTGVFVERLEGRDDRERAYRYAIVECPLPIANAVVEVRIRDNGGGAATVEWIGSFDSEAPGEFQAVRAFQQLYQSALDNLASCVSGGKGERR